MIDPFAILSIDKSASKKEVLQQAALVLRRRRSFDARTVAEAQKMLFSPLARAEAEFLHCQNTEIFEEPPPELPAGDAAPNLDPLELPDDKAPVTP